MRRVLLLTGIAFASAWLALVVSGWAVLVRDDPMYLDPAKVVEDAACTYFDGLNTKTILLRHQPHGAVCERWVRI